MKFKNLSEAILYFPLKTGEAVTPGAVYQIVSGLAEKVTSTVTSNIIGVCQGGNKMIPGKIMLDVDPTSVFKEKYSSKPTIGEYVGGCKLVLDVDEANSTFTYLLRKETATASASEA